MLVEFRETKQGRLDVIRCLLITLPVRMAREDEVGESEKTRRLKNPYPRKRESHYAKRAELP